MEDNELKRMVLDYLERRNIIKYPLDETGIWKIVGGFRVSGSGFSREDIDYVSGRFDKVLEYAIQKPEFYGDWCSKGDPGNPNSGRVEKILIKAIL